MYFNLSCASLVVSALSTVFANLHEHTLLDVEASLYIRTTISTLSLPLVDHQHLICIQRIGLLYVRTLHAQRVQEQGAGTSGVNV